MTGQIQPENFTQALFLLLDETFDNVHGFYLDKGTSMFETLAEISAEEASISVGGRWATLAAHVKHVTFYLDVIAKMVREQNYAEVDWDEIWRTTKEVSPDEWEALKQGLRRSYESIKILIRETPAWPSEREIGGAIGTIVHTAYHLGEIRQALCMIKE
jgi:hypothetical protein